MPITAALFDFGGVILSSPFDAFARYEADRGLPEGFIRRVNASDPDGNAWAQLERNQVSVKEFCEKFEAEATAGGGTLDAREVLALLSGEVRPAMVEAVRRCRERLKTALLTNNVVAMNTGSTNTESTCGVDGGRAEHGEVLDLFDVVIESSRVGVRKPDPRFYAMACAELSIEPSEAVFLDDLGVNLKPARALGMATIKVTDPERAITELEAVVGFPLR